MSNNLLRDLVNTRSVLKEKLKNIKLNEMDKVNMLEDTFQTITKPLKSIISKLDERRHPLKSTNKKDESLRSPSPLSSPSSDYLLDYDDTSYDKTDFIGISHNRGNDDNDDDDHAEHISGFSNPKNHISEASIPINENPRLNSTNSYLQSSPLPLSFEIGSPVGGHRCQSKNNSNLDMSYENNDKELKKYLKRSRSITSSSISDEKNKPEKRTLSPSPPSPLIQLASSSLSPAATLLSSPLVTSSHLLQSDHRYKLSKANKRKHSTLLKDPSIFDNVEGDKKRFKKNNVSKSSSGVSIVARDKKKKLKRKNSSSSLDYFDEDVRKQSKSTHVFSKRKSKTQLNNNKKRIKLNENNNSSLLSSSSSSPLIENIKLLMNNDMLDKVYGFNIDQSGKWRYGTNKLKFHKDNTLYIGDMKIKMTPGLFELLFHSKPLHYTKIDLEKYKSIITTTNVHKRNYQSNKQIKGTKAFKYQRIIKKLFNKKSNILTKGSGFSPKSVDNSKPNYIYWDDPNELVNRLRLLLSSEGVGHNNHKNEIISIIEELREANIIY